MDRGQSMVGALSLAAIVVSTILAAVMHSELGFAIGSVWAEASQEAGGTPLQRRIERLSSQYRSSADQDRQTRELCWMAPFDRAFYFMGRLVR